MLVRNEMERARVVVGVVGVVDVVDIPLIGSGGCRAEDGRRGERESYLLR